MPQPITAPDRMTRIEAAAYLTSIGYPISTKTLAQFASRAHVQGPPYAMFNGRALYEKDDLLAWAESRISPKAASTSEHEDIARRAAA